MSRYYILLIMFFSLVFSYENKFNYNSSHENKISFTHAPDFIELDGGYTRISKFGEGHTTEVGFPELPQFTTYYQIDPQKEYDFQFKVIESYVLEDITVLPHQGMDKWEIETVGLINNDVYNSYESYPIKNLNISDRSQGRGIEFVSISVIPYMYFPAKKRLEVFTRIEIDIIETGVNNDNILRQPKRSYIFDEYYKDIIVNFENSDRQDDYQASSILYICGGNSLNNSFVQDLIDWRHRQGYIVYAATESEVGGSSANNSEIKNYISDAYFNWENPPEIVGLIGDTGGNYSLPEYDHSWGGYSGPTDYDYALLEGSDLIPEIFIGRISASSSSELENIINKTIQYEKAEYVNDQWFTKAGLVGDPDESGNSTIFTNQYIENLMTNHGMSRVQTDYDGSGTQTFMEQQFNNGILYYNYRGWYYGYGSYPTSSINNGFDTPFVTTITCGTGDFNGTASSEEFVRLGSVNNPKGAVAAVGMATTGTHTAYNNIVNMGIYDGIFAKKLWYAGAASSNGNLAIIATYPNPNSAVSAAEAFSKWSNLIGDPALHLWSSTPSSFSVQYDALIPLGTTMQEFTITDQDGSTIEGARVTLLMGDDIIFETGITDENGNVTLSWDSVEAGIISLMVIKRDFRPYEGAIEISTEAGAAISIISDDVFVNSGSEFSVDVFLHNYGRIEASGVKVEVKTESNNISILDSSMEIGDIHPGFNIPLNVKIYINDVAYHMEGIDLEFIITDTDNNQWISSLPLQVMGPYLTISNLNSNLNPGTQTNLILDIFNQGSNEINNFSIEILDNEDVELIGSSNLIIDKLSINENIYFYDFNMSFSSNIINGSIIPIDFLISGSDGSSKIHTLNLTLGEVRETDPLGPDSYGYYIYDSGDIDYDEVPVYDWIEIAEGLGEQVSISDAGNGNSNYTSSTDSRELPFLFNFYGIEYNEIQINTNGWISFGPFEMNAFRNYPLPGAGGPSPMIAAFWDDLMTGSGGYVYYYASLDYVVVQWDDMRTCGDLSGGWYASNCSGGPRQTFQVILYPDSEIKIQYKDFNNSSDGNYPNGGTPSHGCYSTVGIENHLGDIGLQYTFNNSYPEAAAVIQDGSALFITNGDSSDYLLGDMNEDGILNVLDIVTLVNEVLSGNFSISGDMNIDGVVNILDVVILVNCVLSNC